MKLYTEEDIENAFNSGRGYGIPNDIKDLNSFIQSITPIELPSDEEIKKDMGYDALDPYDVTFFKGITYIKYKIQKGNK